VGPLRREAADALRRLELRATANDGEPVSPAAATATARPALRGVGGRRRQRLGDDEMHVRQRASSWIEAVPANNSSGR
jgi:hypothetical protein